MRHYLFGKVVEQTLDASAVARLAQEASRRVPSEVSVRDIVDLLDRVGRRWRDPAYPARSFVLEHLPAMVGFSEVMVAAGLDELARLLSRHTLMTKIRVELGRMSALDGWVWKEGYEGYVRALPLGVVSHVSPGNVFLGAADSLVHGLLTKNANLLKVASLDPVFPILFAESVREADAEGLLAESFSVLAFPGQDDAIAGALKGHSDGLVVWGGAEAIESWRRDVPGHCRFIPYGPRFSFALASHKACAGLSAQALALDVVMWEQRACASPQVLFVEGSYSDWRDFLEQLGQELEALSVSHPAGELELDQKIEIRRERELTAYRGQVLGPEHDFRWSILWRQWEDHHASALNRTLVVVPYQHFEQVLEWLAPHRHQLQSAGLGVTPGQWRRYALRLSAAGVTRVTEFGHMHRAKHGAPHDGSYQLDQLVRWATIEKLPRRFDVTKKLRPPPPSKTRKLAELVSYARAHSGYYHRRLPEVTIQRARDIEQLPCLAAHDLREHTPPLSQDLLTGPFEGAYVFASGGSTGAPKFSLFNYEEWEDVTDILSAIYQVAGVEPGDTVANLFMAGNLWTSFLAASEALEKLGCVTLPIAGNVEVDDLMGYLELFRPTVLLGLPSLLIRVAEVAERNGLELKVPRILYGGEPMTREARRYLERVLGTTSIMSAGYASVDAGPIGFQTPDNAGSVHHLVYDYQFLEFLDPETQLPVASGQVGEIVVTCLRRRLMPLIRYRTGDLGRWVDEDGWLFELKGRIGDRLRVGTADLYPSDVARTLDEFEGLGHLFQLVVSQRGPKDHLCLLVEHNQVNEPPTTVAIETALRAQVRELDEALAAGWLEPLEVIILAPGGIPRVERTGKVRVIVDQRAGEKAV